MDEADGDHLAEIAPDNFAAVAAKITETLALASVRLAEIQARSEYQELR